MGASQSKLSFEELSVNDISTFVTGLGGKYASYGDVLEENAVDGEFLASLQDDADVKEAMESLDIKHFVHQRILLKEWRKACKANQRQQERTVEDVDVHTGQEIELQTTRTEDTSTMVDYWSSTSSLDDAGSNSADGDDNNKLVPSKEVVLTIESLELQEGGLAADSKELEPFKKVATRALEDLKATCSAVNLVSLQSQGHNALYSKIISPSTGETMGLRAHADGTNVVSVCRGAVLSETDDFVSVPIPHEISKGFGMKEAAKYYGHVVKCGGVRVGMVCVVMEDSKTQHTTDDEKQMILMFLAAEAERQLQRRKVIVQRTQNLRKDIASRKKENEDKELLPGYGPFDPVMASHLDNRLELFPYPTEEGVVARRSMDLPSYSSKLMANEAERAHLPPDFYEPLKKVPLDKSPVGKNDMERVALLNSLGILDIEPTSNEGKNIMSLVTMAGSLLGADVITVNLLDHKYKHVMCPTLCSKDKDIGKLSTIVSAFDPIKEKSDGSPFLVRGDRCLAMCNYAITAPRGQAFVSHDVARDSSIAVYKEIFGIGFVSTAPIVVQGYAVGALCVLNKDPRLDFGKAQEVQHEQVTQLIAQQFETWALNREMKQLETERGMLIKNSKLRGPEQPEAYAALVFTGVQGSTALWEADADAMNKALAIHNRIIRQLVVAHSGYEVSADGDTFHVAFADVVDAVQFCLKAQEELNAAPWDGSILALPGACEDILSCFRGLRVRMAIHAGEVVSTPNELSGRVAYSGETFHIAKSLESMGHGGQILVTSDVWNIASNLADTNLGSPQVIDMGKHVMLTHSSNMHDGIISKNIFQLVPSSLAHDYLLGRSMSREVANDDKVVGPVPTANAQKGRTFPALLSKKRMSLSFHDAPHANNTVAMAFVHTAEAEKLVVDPSVLLAALSKSIGTVLSDHRQEFSGYQCKDFLLAFGQVSNAIRFGLALQEYLEHNRVLDLSLAGLIKVGVHEGEFSAMGPHPITGRADYFGRVVKRAARVADAAAHGSVYLGKAASEDVDECNLMPVTNGYMLHFLGVTPLKGVRDEFALYKCHACSSWYDEVVNNHDGRLGLPHSRDGMFSQFRHRYS